jgi:hypothetical protein
MLAFPMLNMVNKFIYNACMFVYVAGLGITLALSIAEALRDFPERAGAASASTPTCSCPAPAKRPTRP